MCKDIFLDRTSKTTYNHLAYMFSFTFIVNIHISKYKKGRIRMNIQLSEHFTYKKLLRFILPSIIMMVFTSIYSVVDGIFVSNFVGKSAFASVNLIMPYLMGISALGFMIGTGGSAFVSKTLGEGKKKLANQYFSMLVTIAAIGGFVLSVLSFIFMRRIVMAFGAAG
mgnify:FL=1